MTDAAREGSMLVMYTADGRVAVVSPESLTERAYGLGRLDQIAADAERLRRALPAYWAKRAVEALEEET